MDTVLISWRIAPTAAPSAPFLSPRPTQRPAARAAASVTRASSRARLRSGAVCPGCSITCGLSAKPGAGGVPPFRSSVIVESYEVGKLVSAPARVGSERLRRLVARLARWCDSSGQPGAGAFEPLLADGGQLLAAFPEFQGLLQGQAAGFQALDELG